MAKRAGVPYRAVGDAEEQLAIIRNPNLWHPRKAFPLVASCIPPYARQIVPILEAEIIPGKTVILAGSLAYGARIVGEQRDVPVFTVDLQPSLMMSVEDSPVMVPGTEWVPRAPRWFRKAFFALGKWQVNRVMAPVGRLEREFGMPRRGKGSRHDWWHSRDGVICLYPNWFGPKAADWPDRAVVTRFPLYDEGHALPPDSELEKFLQAGEAPIVMTPGSANAHAEDFIREAVAGVVKTGRRGILATRYLEQVPKDLPASIKAFEYIPFGQIFPRAAAVIHHGGIGTTAQCLAAGVPQLLMPMAHDQPDNAVRVKKLGVGEYLYPARFKGERIAEMLHTLLTSEKILRACEVTRQRVKEQMSEEEMGELLESLAEQALRVHQINGAGV
jgi:UDP:flavonoid glycosyltransferase YjiC (YdhE family)